VETGSFALPLLIFVAEVCVVTVGTLRIIFVARGHKFVAPALGFFEIMMWLFAAGVTMKNLDNWQCCAAFALGFTLGSYLGILIEKWLALGTVIVRIITHRDAAELIDQLRAANFGVTCIEGQGATGKVQIVLTVVKRKHLPDILAFIETHHLGAFYAVDEVQSACEGVFPAARERAALIPTPLVKMLRLMVPQKQLELTGQGDGQADGGRGEPGEPEPAALR
jgi:uncharacterized protein YebE (UPF0316 family)